jgi:hypothetical protein
VVFTTAYFRHFELDSRQHLDKLRDIGSNAAPDKKKKMKTQHTPGPWSLADHSTVIVSATGLPVCTVESPDPNIKRDERFRIQEANARLIAAAPEMLDACKAALAACEIEFPGSTTGLLRAAIAKATA